LPIINYNGKTPKIGKDVFIAEGAVVIGDVTIGDGSSIWFNAVVRGDFAPIIIGRLTSIQDNCTLHCERGFETRVGDNVVMGHGAIVHSARVGDNCLVGMNCVVLDDAEIGDGSIVGAGAVVGPGKKFPPRSLVVGVPAKVVRQIGEDEVSFIKQQSERYLGYAREYLKGGDS
jgi:carbonic anhydrase/acetyltransferase-like protein (isoleucine patch superfamily)